MSIRGSTVLLVALSLFGAHTCAPQALVAQTDCPCVSLDGPLRLDRDLPGLPLGVAIDETGRIWLTAIDSPPLVFDAAGSLLAELSPPSDPGWGRPVGLVPVADSMMVVDPILGRATVFAPDLSIARSVSLPVGLGNALVVSWPDRVVFEGNSYLPNLAGLGLHTLDLSPAEAVVNVSYDFGDGEMRPGQGVTPRILTKDPIGRVWAASRLLYALGRFSTEGELEELVDLSPAWFPEASSVDDMKRGRRPVNFVDAFSLSAEGGVVLARSARPEWPSAWEADPNLDFPDLFWFTRVDVLDNDLGAVESSTALELLLVGFAAPGVVASYESLEGTTHRVSLYRIRISA